MNSSNCKWQFHDMHVHTRPHSPDAHWRATLPAMLNRAAKNDVWTVGLANHYFLNTKFEIFTKLRQQVGKKGSSRDEGHGRR